jgi:hypothetical protein
MFELRDFLPKKVVCGTTIESDYFYHQMGIGASPKNRSGFMNLLSSKNFVTMVTIEPIMDFDIDDLLSLVAHCNPEWVNIGADSKGHNLPEPSAEKVLKLIAKLKKANIEVKLKQNLKRIIGEFPKELKCSE